MRELYATTMQLAHLDGGDAFETASEVVFEWAWRLEASRPNLAATPSGAAPEDPQPSDVVVRWETVQAPSSRAREITLVQPADGDESIQWRTVVTLSEVGGATRVTIRIGRVATSHLLRPGPFVFRVPWVTRGLMTPPLRAYAGDLELLPDDRDVPAVEAVDFVADVLRSPSRALPVVLAGSGVKPGFVKQLAHALSGLAQVARATNSDADDEFREALQPQTVPRDGLRLYWPGFGSADAVLHNPYWTAAAVRAGAEGGPAVLPRIVRMLRELSADRVPIDARVLEVRREALRANAERRTRAAHRAATASPQTAGDDGRSLETRLAAVTTERDAAIRERDEAITERDEAFALAEGYEQDLLAATSREQEYIAQAETLRLEALTHKENFEAVVRYTNDEDSGGSGDDSGVPEHVETWPELAEHLPSLDGPGFRLTDRALDCADGTGRYPYPERMWQALRSLDRVGRAFNDRSGKVGQRFEDFALQTGEIEIALQDDSYKSDCWFEFEGTRYERLPHVKIDDHKSPDEVGRIYFGLDSSGARVIVDWFGTEPDRPKTQRAG